MCITSTNSALHDEEPKRRDTTLLSQSATTTSSRRRPQIARFVLTAVQNPLELITPSGQNQYSHFGAKPTVVASFGQDNEPVTNRRKSGLRVKQILSSKYHPVVRLDPYTLQQLQPTVDQRNIWAALRGDDSGIAETPKISWNWKHRTVELMGLETPDVIDWKTYQFPAQDPDEEEKKDPCQLPHDWMKQSFPTCNNLHSFDMMRQLLDEGRVQPRFLMGSGAVRSVWLLEQTIETDVPLEQTVLKTLKIDKDFDVSNSHRHRRDALISERLTGSPHILNIYGYCGNSAIYQYAKSGTLYDAIGAKEFRDQKVDQEAHKKWEQWTSQRKLDVAYQVVSALADLHDIDHDGITSVAHDDFDITQLVSTDEGKTFQLSDFNGAPFVKWDAAKKQTCPFRPLMKGGKTRSPEEYDTNIKYVTEKIDIFALGNILYTIVEGQYPFHNLSPEESIDNVMNGHQPHIRESTLKNKDPNIKVLLQAMNACWVWDPRRRATAKEVQNILKTRVGNNLSHTRLP
ncbi:STYKc [Seminavis robusta]|uniref:STYKc n=1 Tax=Seminavis robusta TaxID=568900 RepID=A0A9N8HC96_9STRA|nr:STYKc [Seminavis robusta]|eukprot:Sro293_g109790.1 STYKc (515) ;mRNA; f:11453-13116